ncbi:ABC transporter permease [Acidiferrimicrobium sp. IK]|uniref:ABC transporter permease n=1 Tax=Acidiferrimicrobium sp. IK TaxID=2871700 RepID=UPI0021CB7D68|nr:ABC transporter permease [Acidiferrimicrobium sp. IK]MCU4183529.1 ABC transporter permease [Acidiferrimicrobium sp. IK]
MADLDAAHTQAAAASEGMAMATPPGGPEREFTVVAKSQRRIVLTRFFHHRLAIASLIVLLVLFFMAFFGGHIWHYTYKQETPDNSVRPTWWPYFNGSFHWGQLTHWKHPMGTNELGIDTFAQVLRGAQKSCLIALMTAGLSTVIGTVLGAVAGYYRGWIDSLIMRLTDLFLVFPLVAIAGAIAYKFTVGSSNGWISIAIILALLLWTSICRIVRGVFLSLREKEFVDAARALGASDRRIIFRHLLPSVVGPVIVNATLTVALAILTETILSFIGLGVQQPDTSLGLLISLGDQASQTRPWLFYFPGIFIILICLTVNFVGDGLRDAFDPGQTRVRA